MHNIGLEGRVATLKASYPAAFLASLHEQYGNDVDESLAEYVEACDRAGHDPLRNARNKTIGHAGNDHERGQKCRGRVKSATPTSRHSLCYGSDPDHVDREHRTPDHLAMALNYARDGYFVYRLHDVTSGRCSCSESDCRSPGKHPRSRRGFNDATREEAVIRRWWAEFPNANIGFATGQSNVVGIDLDVKSDVDGVAAWDELCDLHPEFRSGIRAMTPSGGFHVFFRHDLAKDPIPPSQSKLVPGIDVRACRAGIVVAPSVNLNGQYVWIDPLPKRDGLPPLPDALRDLLRTATSEPRRVQPPDMAAHCREGRPTNLRVWHLRLLSVPWTHAPGTNENRKQIVRLAREWMRREPDKKRALENYVADLMHIRSNSPALWERTNHGRKQNPVDREIRALSLWTWLQRNPHAWTPIDVETWEPLRALRRDARKHAVIAYEALCAYARGNGHSRLRLSVTYEVLGDLLGVHKKTAWRWVKLATKAGLVVIVDRGERREAGRHAVSATHALRVVGEDEATFRRRIMAAPRELRRKRKGWAGTRIPRRKCARAA